MNTPPSQPPAANNAQPPSSPGTPSVASVALDPVRILRTYWPWLTSAGIIGVALGITLFIVLNTFAREFTSTAIFLAQPPLSENVTENFGTGIADEEGERFMATQVFSLRSEDTLRSALQEPVIQNSAWARQYVEAGALNEVDALEGLASIVGAGVIPETSYFRLNVTTPVAQDASAIAGAVTDVYIRTYRREANRQARELIANIETQIDSLRGEISELDLRVARLYSEAGVQSDNVGQLPEQLELSNLQPRIVENRDFRNQIADQLIEYERLQNQAGPPVYPDAIREAAIASGVAQQLESNIAAQRASFRAISQSLGEDHPEARRARDLLRSFESEREDVIEQKMAERFAAAIEGFRNQISSLDATHDEMLRKREEITAALVDKSTVINEAREASAERQLKATQLQERRNDRAALEVIANRGGRVSLFSSARVPDRPSFPKPIPVVGVVTVLIFGAVAGIIVLKELREQRIRSPRDISLIPATRVLGVFPQASLDPTQPESFENACVEQPLGAIAESARELRNSILKACDARGHRSIVFTSGLPGAGTSAVITNLAHTAANIEMRVLVIDANLRRPSLHDNFNTSNSRGLADCLNSATQVESVVHEYAPNLHILPAGSHPGHAYERFSTQRMTDILDWAKTTYDLVLIDSPPTVIASDALALAARCDASVLVVRAYSEKRGLVLRIRNMLGDARADFLGVVVNAVKLTAGGYFKQNIRASAQYHNPSDDDQPIQHTPTKDEPTATSA